MRKGNVPYDSAVEPFVMCATVSEQQIKINVLTEMSCSFRLPLVPDGEATADAQPPAGQRQTHGLPAAQTRLQDGDPVRVLPEYDC